MNIWTYAGVVWIMFLFFCPFAFLFTVGSLRTMDSSLEEAARTTGASPVQTMLRVTLPLSIPSILASGLLIFILVAEMYTIPGIIGANAGSSTNVQLSNATAIGAGSLVGASNALVLGGITGVNGGTSVNVGIGTTTPTAKLHVQASGNDIYATFSENDPGGADGYKLQVAPGSGTSTTRIGQLQLNFGGGVNIRNQRNAPTAFLTSDLERMRITGTGSVGIGTTAPTAFTGIPLARASSSSGA